jgi:four helix bundle protein
MNAKNNPLLNHAFQFALSIIEFSTKIEETKKFAIANQILKSGTSIGANIWEAQAPESRNDFVHKMKISAKEATETEYWLMLCKESPFLPDPGDLSAKLLEIKKIQSAIISTCKRNAKRIWFSTLAHLPVGRQVSKLAIVL